jgi:D-3-phosphoglycerate dehydrogenase / 2-oxoglutarate reductase
MIKIWTDLPLVPEARAMLRGKAELFGPASTKVPDQLAGIETAHAAVSAARILWNKALFERAADLRIVARSGIGFDNIDLPAATECGVCVTNTPKSPTEATAELTFALMLALARKLCVADRNFRSTGWTEASKMLGVELAGKTLGLIGLGRIGSRVAEIAHGFRMKVLAYDPAISSARARKLGVKPARNLRDLLRAADVVSIHVPLSAKNRGLIGSREFALMKRGAYLINAARGPIVDEAALLSTLKAGHLGGAGLDVWTLEPTSAQNPLLRLDNVVAAPHIGGATVEAWKVGNTTAVACTLSVLAGRRPPNLLNPEVWKRRRR